MRDAIGSRGEWLFVVRLTEFHDRLEPIFRPQFLGDKFPSVDFFVELVGLDSSPFFLAQVKSTRRGYTARDRRLRADVPKAQLAALDRYPAPTYLFGVDEVNEAVFLLSANGESPGGLSSFPTNYPLDRANRKPLWDEVEGYWRTRRQDRLVSVFLDPYWSRTGGR